MKDMDIVHRDLKPENILVKWNGDEGKKVFKVADFGISRYLNTDVVDVANLTKEYTNGTIIGTPLYMAPEVIMGKPYGHKVDVFSYGLVLYEAATGRHLFGDKLRGYDPWSAVEAFFRQRCDAAQDLDIPDMGIDMISVRKVVRVTTRIRSSDRPDRVDVDAIYLTAAVEQVCSII